MCIYHYISTMYTDVYCIYVYWCNWSLHSSRYISSSKIGFWTSQGPRSAPALQGFSSLDLNNGLPICTAIWSLFPAHVVFYTACPLGAQLPSVWGRRPWIGGAVRFLGVHSKTLSFWETIGSYRMMRKHDQPMMNPSTFGKFAYPTDLAIHVSQLAIVCSLKSPRVGLEMMRYCGRDPTLDGSLAA